MGKHEKQEVKFSWEPPNDDYYKAEIRKLQTENQKLREKVRNLEAEIGRMELEADHDEWIKNGLTLEYGETIKEQGVMILDLKEAIVRAALREVKA